MGSRGQAHDSIFILSHSLLEKAILLHTVIEEPTQRWYIHLQILFSFESKNQGPIAICLVNDVATLLRYDIWSQSTPLL